jgi:hypothetical protein
MKHVVGFLRKPFDEQDIATAIMADITAGNAAAQP